ncbi:hypothetical protein V8J88_14205 [Massilia sp. W12]|uniref:hypothetical protein n=1 Tax=Massilia sp. W12 TaxID=3126507 RepID=UPI0030CB5DBE
MPSKFAPVLPLICIALLCACEQSAPAKPAASAASAQSAAASSAAAPSTPAPAAASQSASATSGAASQPDAQLLTLAQAALGKDWRAELKGGLRELPAPDNRNEYSNYLLEARAWVKLEDGQTILAMNSQPADAEGKSSAGHVTPGALSLYWLKEEQGKWLLMHKEENLTEFGSFGELGNLRFVPLDDKRMALAIEGGGTWQGYSITHLGLLEIQAKTARILNKSLIPLSSDSEGACMPETERCWSIQGEWKFLPGTGKELPDLQLQFKGHESSAAPQGSEERKKRPQQGQATYRFGAKGYQLQSGKNIVPEI